MIDLYESIVVNFAGMTDDEIVKEIVGFLNDFGQRIDYSLDILEAARVEESNRRLVAFCHTGE